MILGDINEARREPDQNPKISIYEFLLPYSKNPDVHIHTTTVNKVGIYPRSPENHDSPIGVYAYRLVDIWDDYIERWNTGEYASKPRGLSMLPYYGGAYTFVLRERTPAITAESYTQEQLESDISKISEWYDLTDGELKSIKALARTNLNFRSTLPVSMLWAITKTLNSDVSSDGFDNNTRVNVKEWNHLLRRLGYTAFSDSGYGYIHGAESTQTVFLAKSAFEVVDLHQKFIKKTFNTGSGQTYQSIPKRLSMKSIPNTFFYNNEPSEFSKVVEWRVDLMSSTDFSTFTRFLPKTAKGFIGTLSMSGSHVGVVRTNLELLKRLEDHTNIVVDTVYIGMTDWMDIVQLLNKFPETANVKNIAISKWQRISDAYLDKLPEHVARRLIMV